jgi:hypothetical protein
MANKADPHCDVKRKSCKKNSKKKSLKQCDSSNDDNDNDDDDTEGHDVSKSNAESIEGTRHNGISGYPGISGTKN